PGGAERSTAYLEVPAVVLAAEAHAGSFRLQCCAQGMESLLLSLPAFAPQGHLRRPERGSSEGATGAPRSQALLESPAQARERLQQVEHGGQCPPAEPGAAIARRLVGERRPDRAQTGPSKEWKDSADEQGQGDTEGTPVHAQRRECDEEDDEQIPFGHLQERTDQRRRGLIERLVRRGSPDAVVHAWPAPSQRVHEPVAVEAAGPSDVPGSVVLLRPLALEHRLGPAVPGLLPPVGEH